MNELESAQIKIKNTILVNPLSEFTSEQIEIKDKYFAAIEYGKLIRDFSELIHYSTRLSIQHRLTLDKEDIERNLYPVQKNFEADFSQISDQIESIINRIEIIEKWVNL